MTALQTAPRELHISLRHPTTTAPSFNEVVMAPKPRIDKIAALVALRQRNTQPIKTFRWYVHNDVTPEQFAKWRNRGVFPLDLGDYKYRAAGVDSATEFVVRKFAIEQTPGIKRLVELVNMNNANAHLKNMPQSIAALIIKMYEVDDDNAYWLAIIENACQVVETFLDVENGKATRDEIGLQESLPDLCAQLGGSMQNELTLGNYMLNLWKLGEQPGDIRDYLNFWLANRETVEAESEAGKAAYNAMTLPNKEPFQTKAGKGVILRTDDRFVTLAARRDTRYDIRVIVSPTTGLVSIASNTANLSMVAARLQELEPGRWYVPTGSALETKVVLNGSPQYKGITPTDLKPSRLIGLLHQYVQPAKKR